MSIGTIILICIASLFVLLLVFMTIRTFFNLQKGKRIQGLLATEHIAGVTEKLSDAAQNTLVSHLKDAVRIPTVTPKDNESEAPAFNAFHQFLLRAYPLIHQYSEKTVVNRYSLVFSLKGTDETLLPAAFLAHQDVVPANAEEWECDPFGAIEKDGYIYGRGAQDMKGHMIALLDALESILAEGKTFKRGIYLCFGHDEECTGVNGARNIVQFLKDKDVRFEFVLDEGGTVMNGGIIGVNGMLALIGTCEKGYMDVVLTANKSGGHASTPAKRTAAGMIAEAVYDLETSPMRSRWTAPTKQLFEELSPYMNPLFSFLFTNRNVLAPLLKLILTKANPVTNALFRTTFAVTELKGSDAPNVLSSAASATVNCRINVSDTTDDVLKHIRAIVGKNIDLSTKGFVAEPSAVSPIDSDSYRLLKQTIEEVFKGFHAAPFPFIAATDSKYYYALTNNVYRFGPFPLSEDDRSRLHAKNERMKIADLATATVFFKKMIQNACL